LTFSATGSACFGPNDRANNTSFDADGNTGSITPHNAGAENGISDVRAPFNALMGVFLGASAPNLSAAPAPLDFSAQAERDKPELRPLLQQVFFIGNGFINNNPRRVIVPAGATRLFLGTMDSFGWFNNEGSYVVTVTLGEAEKAGTAGA
jgi:hypothetical protein